MTSRRIRFRRYASDSTSSLAHSVRKVGDLDLEALGGPIGTNPLVSIVMTSFNSEDLIETAVESLLNQSHSNIEVIVVDDASTDNTLERLRSVCFVDGRVRVLPQRYNRGTYWSKNIGILSAKGEVITFADSDDVSAPERIHRQVEALRKRHALVSTCSYQKVDVHGRRQPQSGQRRFAFISQMMRASLFRQVGYFDSVRTSADDEFLNRVKSVFGVASHVNVDDVLYTALVRPSSLSNSKFNPKFSPETGGLSPARAAYVAEFSQWHQRSACSGIVPYMPFPLVKRPFSIDEKLAITRGEVQDQVVTVVVLDDGPDAAPPPDLMLDSDIDAVYVCHAGEAVLEEGREVSTFEKDELLSRALGTLGEAAGYVLFVHPHFTYAAGYIQSMIRAIECYGREAIVSAPLPFGPGDWDGKTTSLKAPILQDADLYVDSVPLSSSGFHAAPGQLLGLHESHGATHVDVPLVVSAQLSGMVEYRPGVRDGGESLGEIRSTNRDFEDGRTSRGEHHVGLRLDGSAPHGLLPRFGLKSSDKDAGAPLPKTRKDGVKALGKVRLFSSRLITSAGLDPPPPWYAAVVHLRRALISMWSRLELAALSVFVTLAAIAFAAGVFNFPRLFAVGIAAMLLAIGMFAVLLARRHRLATQPSSLAPELGVRSSVRRLLHVVRTRGFLGRTDTSSDVLDAVSTAPVEGSGGDRTGHGGLFEEAVALSLNGESARALASLALAESELRNSTKGPDFVLHATALRALLLNHLGRADAAHQQLEQAKALARDCAPVRDILARFAAAAGDPKAYAELVSGIDRSWRVHFQP